MSAIAAVMRQVSQARKEHDAGKCRYGGIAVEVHFNPADADRLGIEDGEDLCGLTVRLREKQRKGKFRVYCDVELDGIAPKVTTAVATSTVATPALVPAIAASVPTHRPE